MYFHVNLNFSKFNKSAFVGERTIRKFHTHGATIRIRNELTFSIKVPRQEHNSI